MTPPRIRPRLRHFLPAAALVVATGLSIALPAGCSSSAPVVPSPSEAEPARPVLFEDVTAASGIDFTYRNGEEADHYAIIETLGGGVAVFDYDNDGLLDVFVSGGGGFEGKKVLGRPGRLYRNLGGFKFQDVSSITGLSGPLQYSQGVSAFDYDNDGWVDLLVSGYHRLILFRNVADGKGGRKFVDVTAPARLTDGLWSSSTAWGDLNGDGYPDLYVCHYGNWGFEGTGPDGQPYRHPTDCTYVGKTRDICQPAKFTQLPHTVYLNNGDGTFTDVSGRFVRRIDPAKKVPTVGGVRTDGRGIGVLISDVNNDGRPDIYVANDTDENFLYVNRGEVFGRGAAAVVEEVGMMAGVSRDERGTANGSMGIALADFDRTGRASMIVTNYENELPALYHNRTTDPARPRFVYSTQSSGLGALNAVFVSWGTSFADFDLDGWEDLVIVNGHAIRHPHNADRKQKPSLLLNDRGKFKSQPARGGTFFATPHNARGTAVADLDNDGRPDVLVVGHNEPVVVLKNVAPTAGKHWVGLTLRGAAHRDIVGSRVVLETAGGKQARFVKGGASYGSTDDPRLLFGLASDDTILKCTIFWSHGKAEDVSGLAVDRYFHVTEGVPLAKPVSHEPK